jgi:hypothetical protein
MRLTTTRCEKATFYVGPGVKLQQRDSNQCSSAPTSMIHKLAAWQLERLVRRHL